VVKSPFLLLQSVQSALLVVLVGENPSQKITAVFIQKSPFALLKTSYFTRAYLSAAQIFSKFTFSGKPRCGGLGPGSVDVLWGPES
jgi:hypothetical protein